MTAPELSIVIASRGRPLRLRWLLNALEAQTLERSRFEVIDVRDGWRLARAPSVVFIDDDVRPPEEWLAGVLDAVRRHPGAVIQGVLQCDPDEQAMRHAPFWRTLEPGEELCNVVCPRELLELAGQDALLGSDHELDERMLVYSAVEDGGLAGWLRSAGRLRDRPLRVRRNPRLRNRLHGKVFYKRSHAVLLLALAALALQRKYPPLVLLVLPWAIIREPRHHGIRGRIRHLMELPGWAVIDAAELAALAAGSVRHRSLVL